MARGKGIGTFGFCNECGERRAGTRSRSGLRCGTCGEPLTPMDVGGDNDDGISSDEDIATTHGDDNEGGGIPDDVFEGLGNNRGADD